MTIQDRIAFARDRKTYKNKLLGSFKPVLEHYYLLLLLDRTGFQRMRDHWDGEYNRFLRACTREIGKDTDSGKDGKRKAFRQAVVKARLTDDKDQEDALVHFVGVFEEELRYRPIPELTPVDADNFWEMLAVVAEEIISRSK